MAPIHIELLGRFRLHRGAAQLADHEIGSRKGRLLLKLLVARRGHLVHADQIIEALWEGAAPARPKQNVAVLVSRLRGILGPDVIEGGRAGYLFRCGFGCTVDVDEAQALVQEAQRMLDGGQLSPARDAAASALAILRSGEALEDEPYADWAEPARLGVRRLHRAARQLAWTVALRRGELDEAVEIAEQAVGSDPLDEDAHRARMLALYRKGQAALALTAYEDMAGALRQELQADPSHESESLYQRMLRGEELTDALPAASPGLPAPEGQALGRERELASLRESWEGAAGGALVLISGEAGIGKTHLAAALASQIERTGGLVLRSRCYEVERSLVLQPFADALRSIVPSRDLSRGLGALTSEQLGMLTDLVPELSTASDSAGETHRGTAAEPERRRLFSALSTLLEELSRERSLIVVLDDLHLASETTVEFVHWLMRRSRLGRCLVLGLVRAEEEDAVRALQPLARRLSLQGLPAEAVAALAAGEGLADAAPRISQLTAGHALYVTQALRAMRETGTFRIPDSLRTVITERVRRAGTEVEEFLRAAAVTGDSIDLDLITELLGRGRSHVTRLGEAALRRGLLVEAGFRYRFAHDIVRETLYEAVPGPTRASWHRQVAIMLQERGAPAEEVGLHAQRSGEWSLASQSFLIAGRSAAGKFANREAERLLTEALAAASNLNDQGRTADALFERGKVLVALEDYTRADEDFDAALKLARAAGLRTLEPAVVEQLGWSAYFRRDLEVAAERAAEARQAAPRAVTAHALAARVDHGAGRLQQAEGAAREAVSLASETGDAAATATALGYLGGICEHLDRYGEAIDLLERAESGARQTGQLHPSMSSAFFRALALGNRGDLRAALSLLDDLRRECLELEYLHYLSRALNGLAWIWLELGEVGRGREMAEAGAEVGAGMEEPHANSLLIQADACLRQGAPDRAAGLLARSEPIGLTAAYGWRFELRAIELGARIERARGRDVRQHANQLAVLARDRGAAKYEALGLALAGDHRSAARIARRLGSDLLLAKVGPQPEAEAAAARIAGGLPPELRQTFVASWQQRMANDARPA